VIPISKESFLFEPYRNWTYCLINRETFCLSHEIAFFGQIGNGGYNSTNLLPVEVIDSAGHAITQITSISAGVSHSLALATDGKVYAWGQNNNGQLGDLGWTNRDYADTVVDEAAAELMGIQEITAGGSHNLALEADNTMSAWGDNSQGQLGDGTTLDSNAAIFVLDGLGIPVIF
jgi:alpha-tubulin suppressor-like RCC1 family protein